MIRTIITRSLNFRHSGSWSDWVSDAMHKWDENTQGDEEGGGKMMGEGRDRRSLGTELFVCLLSCAFLSVSLHRSLLFPFFPLQ